MVDAALAVETATVVVDDMLSPVEVEPGSECKDSFPETDIETATDSSFEIEEVASHQLFQVSSFVRLIGTLLLMTSFLGRTHVMRFEL